MLQATKTKAKPKAQRRRVRFPGLIADAKELGVHRVTLYRMLTGEWAALKGLRVRYDALKAQQASHGGQPQ